MQVETLMYTDIEIRGGAGEFEVAVVGIVLDHIAREENAARHRSPRPTAQLSAWMQAMPQPLPNQTPPAVTPDAR